MDCYFTKKYCVACGRRVGEDWNYCLRCGAEIPDDIENVYRIDDDEHNPLSSDTSTTSNACTPTAYDDSDIPF